MQSARKFVFVEKANLPLLLRLLEIIMLSAIVKIAGAGVIAIFAQVDDRRCGEHPKSWQKVMFNCFCALSTQKWIIS